MSELEKTISFRAAPGAVEQTEAGTVIRDVAVVTEGEALGHGVFLDASFVQTVIEQGNAFKRGLKARFGHPTMCSEALGTYLGRFKNLRAVETEMGLKAVADMHLAESAKAAPGGDLHAYVMKFANDDPEAFGTSIVFRMGDAYRKDKNGKKYKVNAYSGAPVDMNVDEEDLEPEIYASCDKLFGCDFVDEPAANPDGLYSAFSAETIAGKVGRFFEQYPDVVQTLATNPDIVDILKKHGDKVDVFLKAYTEQSGEIMDEEIKDEVAPVAEQPPVEPVVAEPAPIEPEAALSEGMQLSEYREILLAYGQDIAEKCFADKTGMPEAVKQFAAKLADENQKLRDENAAFKARKDTAESDGVSFADKPIKPKRSLTAGLKL
jgi:hypothetical protein